MLRTLFAYLLVVFFFIISIPCLIIFWLIGKISMNARDTLTYGMMRMAFSIILFVCGVKMEVNGVENIPTDTPVLYVGNHRSYVDIIVGYRYIPGKTGFIAKKEFLKVPVLSHWIAILHGLFLDRKDIKAGLKTVLEAIEHIKNDKLSYFIFPEGTRNKEKEMMPFKEGSMKIATKSGCPIVPVALTGTAEILEKNKYLIKPGKVSISFGEPIYTDKLDKEESKFLGAKVRDIIKEMMDKVSE